MGSKFPPALSHNILRRGDNQTGFDEYVSSFLFDFMRMAFDIGDLELATLLQKTWREVQYRDREPNRIAAFERMIAEEQAITAVAQADPSR